MGFLLGFMLGLFAVAGLFVFLVYWLCTRPNHIAVAKAINGVAQALAHTPKSPEPATPGTDGEEADYRRTRRWQAPRGKENLGDENGN